MTENEFKHISAAIVAAWPRSAWPESTIALGFSILQKFSAEHVRKAVVNLVKEGREFAPPPGVVYAYTDTIERATRPLLTAAEPTPSDWERGRRRIKEVLGQVAAMAERKQMTTIGRPK